MSIPSDTNPNEPGWPADLLDASDVRAWIASALARRAPRPMVAGPVEVYQENGWGVTARFAVAPPRISDRPGGADPQGSDGVVFSACALPIYAYTPDVYRVLMPRVPGRVPELLASARRGDQIWTLFRRFTGEKISAAPSLGAFEDLARLTARIQASVAGLPRAEWGETPHLPVRSLPALFEEILADIRDRHRAAWNADNRAIAGRFGLPADPLDALAAYRADVTRWARELEAGGWPDTVDHDDLQGDNAARLPDGRLLLYDWEGALVGCPFFSLDRLLDDARALDRPRWEAPAGDILADIADPTYGGTALAGSPAERAVRDAYLDAIPWGARGARERALDLALCLAPIRAAHVSKFHTLALGREEAFSLLTAVCVARALHRWRSMREKYAGE